MTNFGDHLWSHLQAEHGADRVSARPGKAAMSRRLLIVRGTAGLAAATAAAVLALIATTPGTTAGIAAATASPTAIPAQTTAGSATPALASVTTALTSTLSQNYHVVQQETEHLTVNGQTRTYPYTCSGAADPVRQLLAMSCSENTAVREVGGYTYDLLAGPASGHADGKPWVRYPAGFSPGLDFVGIDILHTARQLLAEIKREATVTVAGPASGPGWTGTRYAYRSSPVYGFGGTVTVDQQGRVRAMTGTVRETVIKGLTYVDEQILTFSDFGVPVTVTPPPPSQTSIAPLHLHMHLP